MITAKQHDQCKAAFSEYCFVGMFSSCILCQPAPESTQPDMSFVSDAFAIISTGPQGLLALLLSSVTASLQDSRKPPSVQCSSVLMSCWYPAGMGRSH